MKTLPTILCIFYLIFVIANRFVHSSELPTCTSGVDCEYDYYVVDDETAPEIHTGDAPSLSAEAEPEISTEDYQETTDQPIKMYDHEVHLLDDGTFNFRGYNYYIRSCKPTFARSQSIVPDLFSCQKYMRNQYLGANTDALVLHSCREDEIFDTSLKQCLYSDIPDDCEKYFEICHNVRASGERNVNETTPLNDAKYNSSYNKLNDQTFIEISREITKHRGFMYLHSNCLPIIYAIGMTAPDQQDCKNYLQLLQVSKFYYSYNLYRCRENEIYMQDLERCVEVDTIPNNCNKVAPNCNRNGYHLAIGTGRIRGQITKMYMASLINIVNTPIVYEHDKFYYMGLSFNKNCTPAFLEVGEVGPDLENCMNYYKKVSSNHHEILHCPEGEIFSMWSKKCVKSEPPVDCYKGLGCDTPILMKSN